VTSAEKAVLIAKVAETTVALLRAQREPEPAPAPAPTSGMPATADTTTPAINTVSSIAQLERFLNERCTWWYKGGYAMFKWLEHYKLDRVETIDLDIIIADGARDKVFLELFGQATAGEKEWLIEGQKISLLSTPGDTIKHQLGDAWVVSPDGLAHDYGFDTADTGEKDEEKEPKNPAGGHFAQINAGNFKLKKTGSSLITDSPSWEQHSEKTEEEDESKLAKAERRGRRRAQMPALLAKYHEDLKAGKFD
jgi:hypothetical protein